MEQIIINGDNIEVLKNYPDNYFDAVVTDPPYGLGKEPNAVELMKDWIEHGYHEIKGKGFMGKEWDAFVPQPLFWKEVFRVLKHGGHVVSFFGTRTYDWGVMSMRFAGFEVRDCIQWLYGCLSDDTEIFTRSGYIQYHKFIKLPNFEEQEILIYDAENDIYKWEKPERWNEYNIHKDTCYRIKSNSTDQIVSRNHRCLVEREGNLVFIEAELLSQMEYMPTLSDDFFVLQESKVLQSSMQRTLSGSRMEEMGKDRFRNIKFESALEGKQRREESILERWNNLSEKERVLLGSQVEICEMPERVCSNGEKGWVCCRVPFDYGKAVGQTLVENGMRTSYRPQSNEQRYNESDVVCIEQGTQTIRTRRSYSTTLATITPIEYSGVIFCPTVSTGAFVARRNGKIFLTGNSGFPKSHNISKAIDKMPKASGRLMEFANLLKSKRLERGLSILDADKLICNGSTMYNFLEGRNVDGVMKIYPPNEIYYEKIKEHFDILGWDDVLENNLSKIGIENGNYGFQKDGQRWNEERDIKVHTTQKAKDWDGWGSALKPANEPIVLARKPLEKGLSIAENVLKWGTGGINIDGSRIGYSNDDHVMKYEGYQNGAYKSEYKEGTSYKHGNQVQINPSGRFPANIILTHHPECECNGLKKVKGTSTGNGDAIIGEESNGAINSIRRGRFIDRTDENGEETVEDWSCHPDCPIKILDEQSGVSKSTGGRIGNKNGAYSGIGAIGFTTEFKKGDAGFGDKGGASRFFYVAKASKSERNRGLDGFDEKTSGSLNFRNPSASGRSEDAPSVESMGGLTKPKQNFHPTVKPVKLMQYLVRLITPPNGKVLDPFCGSGTTGIACKLEGFDFVGIEQDPEYTKIAKARIANWDEVEDDEIKIENKIENTNSETQVKEKIIQSKLFDDF